MSPWSFTRLSRVMLLSGYFSAILLGSVDSSRQPVCEITKIAVYVELSYAVVIRAVFACGMDSLSNLIDCSKDLGHD
jgi:hypothetical protein